MRARVIHTFTYRYSAPVLLGPHRFCLKPRGHGFQRLLDFQLAITPEPGRLYPLVAASGDEILRARFSGATDAFLVRASSLVETDFLNRTLHIHRRAHESVSADHGELVYRSDGVIEEVSTTSIEPLYAELEHFLQCVRGVDTPAVDGLQASRALQLADPDGHQLQLVQD